MTKRLSNEQIADLNDILMELSQLPRMPLKLCIARNLRALEEPLREFMEEQQHIFKYHSRVSSEGNPIFRDNYIPSKEASRLERHPYEAFVFKTDESYDEFSKEADSLAKKLVDISFIQEDLNRLIFAYVGGELREIPLKEILDDPSSPITPRMIMLFSEYFLKV